MYNKTADWRTYVFPTVGALAGAVIGGGIPRLVLSEEKRNLGTIVGAIIGSLLGGGTGYLLSTIPTKKQRELALLEKQRQAQRFAALQQAARDRILLVPTYEPSPTTVT